MGIIADSIKVFCQSTTVWEKIKKPNRLFQATRLSIYI